MTDQTKYLLANFSLNFPYKAKMRKLDLTVFIYFLLVFEKYLFFIAI